MIFCIREKDAVYKINRSGCSFYIKEQSFNRGVRCGLSQVLLSGNDGNQLLPSLNYRIRPELATRPAREGKTLQNTPVDIYCLHLCRCNLGPIQPDPETAGLPEFHGSRIN